VILSRERIEEVMNDAVKRGRITADDAQSTVQRLFQRGRKETNDVVRDLERLAKRGRSEVETRTTAARKRSGTAASRARKQVEDATSRVRTRAVRSGEPALAQVDRVRRAAGVPPRFPILSYDDLTAAQVQGRLSDLTPAELRKVRDYERRNANRKSVLNSIGTRLG
jgi:polyhydroxyalkanoate synthesis regulator phasin